MATPWDRIKDDNYQEWLLGATGLSVAEFNQATPAQRVSFRTKYDSSRQPQQQQPPPPTLRLFKLRFRQNASGSSGVPQVDESLEEFDLCRLKPLPVEEDSRPLVSKHHLAYESVEVNGEPEERVYYSREIEVQTLLEQVVMDVIKSCNYDLITQLESALNGLRVDVGMLRRSSNDALCGTLEVKQPKRPCTNDPDPMTHPKVITQVASQMIPLRTMYGVKNVYGILSCYSSWRFFRWVLEGEEGDVGFEELTESLNMVDLSPAPKKSSEAPAFSTPRGDHQSGAKTDGKSTPPISPQPYRVGCAEEDNDDEEEAGDSTDEIKRGTLYASEVITDGPKALRVLAWVLGEMARSPVHPVPAQDRDYLYVVCKDAMGGYEKVQHTTDLYRPTMPRADCGKLYLLDELGHRHQGRVYRATSKSGRLCVLKYFVKTQNIVTEGKRKEALPEAIAKKAVEYWNKAYQGLLPLARCGNWGGGHAIMMPDLERMSADVHHGLVLEKLKETMKVRFFEKEIWHGDPAWRNVALVRDEAGQLAKVCMLDLEPGRMVERFEIDNEKWGFEKMWKVFEKTLTDTWEEFKSHEQPSAAAPKADDLSLGERGKLLTNDFEMLAQKTAKDSPHIHRQPNTHPAN